MKKIIGIIIAGIIIMTLFGNGKSRGTRVNKEAENRTGTETTVTGGQNAGSEQESEENLTENQEEETEPEEEQEPEEKQEAEEEQEPEEDLEPEEEQEPEDEPEDEQNESAEDGISPEFKAAMDSYEEFFDEYVAFMEKYSKSSNPSGMIMDYSEYMMKYADTMNKLNQVDYDKLTVPEQAYYIEVMARIQKKLLQSTQ